MTDEIVGERIRSKIDEWNSVEPTNELVTGYKDYQKYIGRKWSFTFLFILAAIVVVGIAMFTDRQWDSRNPTVSYGTI